MWFRDKISVLFTEHDPKCAVYYGNRAMALICLEDYPHALEDSLTAVKLDEKFVKVSVYLVVVYCLIMTWCAFIGISKGWYLPSGIRESSTSPQLVY